MACEAAARVLEIDVVASLTEARSAKRKASKYKTCMVEAQVGTGYLQGLQHENKTGPAENDGFDDRIRKKSSPIGAAQSLMLMASITFDPPYFGMGCAHVGIRASAAGFVNKTPATAVGMKNKRRCGQPRRARSDQIVLTSRNRYRSLNNKCLVSRCSG